MPKTINRYDVLISCPSDVGEYALIVLLENTKILYYVRDIGRMILLHNLVEKLRSF